MNITGYNYYGVIYVSEGNSYKDVVTEYNNITYVGPQISFHPSGLTRFINSNITIQENYAAGNEVAECNKIEIGGNTTIIHKSTANSSFWFRNSGFVLNNPYKVMLYNPKANIIYTNSTIPFEFNFSRINLFNTIVDKDSWISDSTLPTYSWYKEKESSIINGTFTNSAITISSNNFTTEELNSLPSLDNFIFQNKRILTIGDFQIHMNALTDTDTSMTGITGKDASILITYNDITTIALADENDNMITLSDSKTLVYTGTNNDGSVKITNVTFDNDKGILLKVTEPLMNNMEYESVISWSIEE